MHAKDGEKKIGADPKYFYSCVHAERYNCFTIIIILQLFEEFMLGSNQNKLDDLILLARQLRLYIRPGLDVEFPSHRMRFKQEIMR